MTSIRPLTGTAVTAPTLADVLLHVEQETELSPGRREQLASALRTVGRVLDRRLEEIPARPGWLRDALAGVSPAAHGFGKGRWANIRSLLRAALALAGAPVLAGRSTSTMSAAWADLYALLPDQSGRNALSRTLRLLTDWRIAPADVTPEVFDRLQEALVEGELVKRPHALYRDAVKAWNRAAASVPGWPQLEIPVPNRRVLYSKPWEAFPASFGADVEAMIDASTRPEFGLGRRMPLIRANSAAARKQALRAFASALIDDGVPAERLQSLADLIDPKTAERGLRHLYARGGNQVSRQLHTIAVHLCTVARHWVRVSPEHEAQLRTLCKALDPKPRGMTEKNRATLRAFEDPHMVRRLLVLPDTVRRRVRRDRLREVDAVRMQVALAVEMLIVAPVRIRNLGGIHLDRHLIRVGDGRSARWHLHFPADEVKNDVEIELPLPAETGKLLHHYLTEVRPTLVRAPNRWLFPGAGTNHKKSNLLGVQIADLVSEIVGVRVTPHQFRHLAGYLYLQQNPGAIEVVRRLLGHKSIQTTLAFYAGMEQAAAARHYDDHIAARRATSPARVRR